MESETAKGRNMGYFLEMELQGGTLSSTYSFKRNMNNYYGPGTPVVCMCGSAVRN